MNGNDDERRDVVQALRTWRRDAGAEAPPIATDRQKDVDDLQRRMALRKEREALGEVPRAVTYDNGYRQRIERHKRIGRVLDLLLAFAMGALAAWSLGGCAHMGGCAHKFPEEIRVCSAVVDVLPAEVRHALDQRNISAITVGPTTFYLRNADDPCLQAHEAVHREQYAREGAEFLVNYAAEHKSRGYEGNRYEVEARAAQEKCEAGR